MLEIEGFSLITYIRIHIHSKSYLFVTLPTLLYGLDLYSYILTVLYEEKNPQIIVRSHFIHPLTDPSLTPLSPTSSDSPTTEI